jgi:hypothetical protein
MYTQNHKKNYSSIKSAINQFFKEKLYIEYTLFLLKKLNSYFDVRGAHSQNYIHAGGSGCIIHFPYSNEKHFEIFGELHLNLYNAGCSIYK